MKLIARNCLERLPTIAVALLVLLVAVPAYAHHPMGGVTPSSFGEGLLSGIGHPIIGIDHLAFVIGIGLAASFLSRGMAMPAFFVGATLLGTGIHLLAVNLPMVEIVISAGFAITQYLIAGAAFLIAVKSQSIVEAKPVGTRLAGSFVAGVGFVFLFTAIAPF